MAQPTIEQIEREIRQARFEEGEGDRFLARRAQKRMTQAAIQGMKDDKVRRAYLAGFKAGYAEPRMQWAAVYVIAALIVGLALSFGA